MSKNILLTRPRPSSERWAALLAQHGIPSVIEPLLTITSTGLPRPTGRFQAIILTSSNALDALAADKGSVADLLTLPCFCIGASTAEAARLFGFTTTENGTGDSADLARKMIASLTEKYVPILHIAGDIVDPKAQDLLTRNGFTVTAWPVYHATAAEDFSAATKAAFAAGAFSAIPVFSPRSARILVSLLEKNRLVPACHAITAIALSHPVADVLQTVPWRALRIAPHPREEDMLACLQSEETMTETPSDAAPPPAVTPSKKRSRKALLIGWSALGAILIAAALVLLPVPDPRGLLKAPTPKPPEIATAATIPVENAQPEPATPDIATLQKRVETLEQRIDTPPTAPNPAPTPAAADLTANVAGLADTVKSLQAQVAQIDKDTHKIIASTFAFWDMREAARRGEPFATQLSALSTAASDDPSVTEPIAKLKPYAAAGAPTILLLRDSLLHAEATMTIPETASENATAWDRLKAVASRLISVHPLHDPLFAPLEQALEKNDLPAAQEAFKLLPLDRQQKLDAWQQNLAARLTVDEALRELATHYATPLPGNPS